MILPSGAVASMAVSSSGYPPGGMERHCAVDLLPDRSTETFATWLAAHPSIEVVSRDRGGEYAEGARQGAPHAIHTAHRAPADRFHLLHNLRDVACRVFKRHAQRLAQVAAPGAAQQTLTRLRFDWKASNAPTRGEMHARFTTIYHLATIGMSRSAIARELGIHRHTVQKYLAHVAHPNGVTSRARRASWRPTRDTSWHSGTAGDTTRGNCGARSSHKGTPDHTGMCRG